MIETLSSHHHHHHPLAGPRSMMNNDIGRFEGYSGGNSPQEYSLPKLLSSGPQKLSRSPLTISTTGPLSTSNPSPTSVSSLDSRSLGSFDEQNDATSPSARSSSPTSKSRKLSQTGNTDDSSQAPGKKQKVGGDKPTKKHPKCLYENCSKFARRVGEFQYCMRHLPKNMKRWCIVCNEHIAQYAGRKCASCAGKVSTPSMTPKKADYIPAKPFSPTGLNPALAYHHHPSLHPAPQQAAQMSPYHHQEVTPRGPMSPMNGEGWYYPSASTPTGRAYHAPTTYHEYLSMIHELSANGQQQGLPSPSFRGPAPPSPAAAMWMESQSNKMGQHAIHHYSHAYPGSNVYAVPSPRTQPLPSQVHY